MSSTTSRSLVGDVTGILILELIGSSKVRQITTADEAALPRVFCLRGRLFHVVAVNVVERKTHVTLLVG